MKQETVSGKIVDLKILTRLFVFVKPYLKQFYFLILLTIARAVLVPARPLVIQLAIDNEVVNGDYQGLVYMIMILVALLFCQAIVQYSHTYLSGWLGQYIIRDIRIKLYAHLQRLQLKFFDKTPIGQLVTRNVSDIETLAEVFSQGVAMMIGDILQLSVILGVMLWLDWRLALVSLSTLPILLFSTYVFLLKLILLFSLY